MLYLVLYITTLSVIIICQEDLLPLGDGLMVMDATCDMKISACSSPPCRYYCPADCNNTGNTQIFTQDSAPCSEALFLYSAEGAVDIFIDENDFITVQKSIHTASVSRRDSEPFCVGHLSLANDASICIVTCSLPDYECPTKYKQRCGCPWDKPILKDVDKGICVSNFRECPPFNTYILSNDGLSEFKFTKQPVDLVKKRGDKIRMYCTVSGDTNYQYFWFKSMSLVMGSHSISGSENVDLVQTGNPYYDINSVQSYDAGFYHCVVRTGDSVNMRDAKYSLISNTGYLRVEYFDTPSPLTNTITITTQVGALTTVLPCPLPKSVPQVEAAWYKDGETVSDPRIFVIPARSNGQVSPGSMYIVMVTSEDAGTYTCKVTYEGIEYEVSKVTLDVSGHIGQPNSDPEFIVELQGRAKVGETATFYCAGVGNPVPNVTWTKEDGTRIDGSDTVELTDFNRRLRVSNAKPDMDRAYACTISAVGNKNPKKTILYLSVSPSTYDINFVETPVSQIITPNYYTPFTLQCAITVDPVVEAPVMYWLKNGATLDMKPISRIRTETKEDTIDGITIRNSTLIFETPNESDKGVYQCMVENKEQMRQVTAFIDVKKSEVLQYSVYYPREYDVITTPMKVWEAAETCKNKEPRGKWKLVTISNKNESENVFRLLVERGVTRSWIGLNSENSVRVMLQRGVWNWGTDLIGNDFSYWYTGNPDNALGNETYSVMDVTKAGHWMDVRGDEVYPAVCSRFTALCPSVTRYYNGSAMPVFDIETLDTVYDVGKVVTVSCADKERGGSLQPVVTCQPSGEFYPSSIPCPVVSRAGHVTRLSLITILISLVTL